jgi:hypothetical protein
MAEASRGPGSKPNYSSAHHPRLPSSASMHGSQLRHVCRRVCDHVRLLQRGVHGDQRAVLAGMKSAPRCKQRRQQASQGPLPQHSRQTLGFAVPPEDWGGNLQALTTPTTWPCNSQRPLDVSCPHAPALGPRLLFARCRRCPARPAVLPTPYPLSVHTGGSCPSHGLTACATSSTCEALHLVRNQPEPASRLTSNKAPAVLRPRYILRVLPCSAPRHHLPSPGAARAVRHRMRAHTRPSTPPSIPSSRLFSPPGLRPHRSGLYVGTHTQPF